MPTDPAALAEQLVWPLDVVCEGTTDCPSGALDRTLARLTTTRGDYHLFITQNRYTRSRSLWVAWQPRESGLLVLIDEQPEGLVLQALVVIAQHLDDGQPG
jgi:hypothetical protein